MKNWFVKNSERIAMTVMTTIIVSCMGILIASMVNSIKTFEPIPLMEDDYIEQIELTDEMVEAYVALVYAGMED